MKNNTRQNGGDTTAAITRTQTIKLGLDAHADSIVVVRIVDGGAPERARSFSREKFLEWLQKQIAVAGKVYCCYEAGPLGFGLQRTITSLGAVCYVVRPRNWDEYGTRVKTDQRDAHELALCLDRYVSGNTSAFCVVRVPTPEEEQRRSLSRHREGMRKEVQRLAQRGRGNALFFGYRLGPTRWWAGAAWKTLEASLPEHLLQVLRSLRLVIVAAEEQLKSFTRAVENSRQEKLPVGMGRWTAELLDREVADWSRFRTGRKVSSYTGLCPREDSSGPRRFQGSINKHGNRRLRPVLIECMWRLVRFQPNYRVVKKWKPLLCDPRATGARRKKIIVAMARQFAVDWWRIRTGRLQASDLGLI